MCGCAVYVNAAARSGGRTRQKTMSQLIADQEFEALTEPLARADYDYCTFRNCNFERADFFKLSFSDCTFEHCNLSNANIAETAFKTVRFADCKLLGLHFEHCNPFLLALHFERCQLDLSVFYQLELKGTQFLHCSAKEADFSEANLSGASFAHSNLQSAMFDQCNLEKADFREASNFIIHPDHTRLKSARFSSDGLAGLLQHTGIVFD